MAKPVILVVDDLATSYESLVASIGRHDGGRLAREFDYIHLDCFSALRQWYSRNRSRFVSLIVQDVDFSHVQDERKLVDYPDILKPLRRTLDIKALQGFLIYGYLRQNNIDRIAPVIFVSCRIGMESTSEFSEFIIRPGYGLCSFVPESAVGDQYYPKIAESIDALAIRPLTEEQRNNWTSGHHMVIGRARKMAFLAYEIERIGPSDATVLLLGGPGVGKELVANALHRCSYRYVENDPGREYPLTVNMAALSPNLVEDELFGHQRGAFTGATGERAGILESARGSTVFLDEIGDIGQETQVKLLRAMEYHRIKRVGSSREMSIDMRIIAATNRTVPELQTRFRPDFYGRLVQHCIPVPSIRERWENEPGDSVEADIEDLAQFVIRTMNASPRHKRHLGIERTAVKLIRQVVQQHVDGSEDLLDGNIRTLRNIIERAYERAQYDGSPEIGLGHVMPALGMVRLLNSQTPRPGIPGPGEQDQITVPASTETPTTDPFALQNLVGTLNLQDVERRAIKEALEKTGNNQTHAAELLGIHRDTLRRKMAEHEI
ncbi:sigma-54-dependent Fis family transcriptional regulator [candidate division WOR-3 bacterium]|nr:sigma-54-dependent Fis family transcriptional regulator [candidate division WOR-3 bacterium]